VSQTIAYIKRLEALQEGDRSRLRGLAAKPMDESLSGFDLFTGLWWPLRAKSPATPRREPSWLVAKLYGSFPIPHDRPDTGEKPTLPAILGRCEPYDPPDYKARDRFRRRFDALLCSRLSALEPHLRWALGEIARAVAVRVPDVTGIDWAQLLDDLSIWDRGEEQRLRRDVRDIWAEKYLRSTHQTGRRE
jgi:CRISPR type I-E-associated protein CasB/Cse2